MWCGGCARAVEKALLQRDGVLRASAHLESATLSVEIDEAVLGPDEVSRLCSNLGYRLSRVNWTGQRGEDVLGKEYRSLLYRLASSLFFAMWLMLVTIPTYRFGKFVLFPDLGREAELTMGGLALILSLPILIYGALPFHRMAWRWLKVGMLGTDLLVSLGALFSWVLSAWALWQGRVELYCDALAGLVILLLWARILQIEARQRSHRSLDSLLAQAPDLYRPSELAAPKKAELAVTGDIFWLKGPCSVPLDGIILKGTASVDESLLTGESVPRTLFPGDRLLAGTQLLEGCLTASCLAPLGSRRIDDLARGMRSAQAKKGSLTGMSEKAAVWVTRLLIGAALLTGLAHVSSPNVALERALALLVVGCPCALTLAVPLATHVIETRAREDGIAFLDGRSLEELADIRRIVFDKTGTLSLGQPLWTSTLLRAPGWTQEQARLLAASAQYGNSHPFSVALREGLQLKTPEVPSISLPGLGVKTGGVLVGSARLLEQEGVRCQVSPCSSCELAVDGVWVATFLFADRLNEEALEAVSLVAAQGYEVSVRSGDRPQTLRALAGRNIPWRELSGGLSPEEKTLGLDDGRTAFVGDGINDSLALSTAKVGIAVGAASATTVESAGLQLRSVADLPRAIAWSQKAKQRMTQCLVASVVYNLTLLPLASFGWVSPSLAALAMGLSSVTVVMLAVR